jgi:hypothetical protein
MVSNDYGPYPPSFEKILDLLKFLARGRQCESDVQKLWCRARRHVKLTPKTQVFLRISARLRQS